MNVEKRLSDLEKSFSPPIRIVVRLTDDNGDYPEKEEDMRTGGEVIKIRLPEEDGDE